MDPPEGYGWLSIGIHWLSAGAILALLFIGDSIDGDGSGHMLHLHTSVAVTAYGLLGARIVWRIVNGYPPAPTGTSRVSIALAHLLHAVLMLALTAMLLSGPLLAWSNGRPVDLWSWRLVQPHDIDPGLFTIAYNVHQFAARCLGWGILIHIIAVAKHVAINRDATMERMLVPAGGAPGDTSRGAATVRSDRADS